MMWKFWGPVLSIAKIRAGDDSVLSSEVKANFRASSGLNATQRLIRKIRLLGINASVVWLSTLWQSS
jgi:hypothetical protein